LRICIVLPGSGQNPVGGLKVAYEYANGLVRRGHDVTVIHAPLNLYGGMDSARTIKRYLVYGARMAGIKGGYRPKKWFVVDPRVRMKWLPSLNPCWIPNADAVIATAWETAEWVAGYPPDKGQKFYLIQHQESTFDGVEPERAMATWKLPLQKIVISRWLDDIARGLHETAVYIPNGLDFSAFSLDLPPAERNPAQLIMLYHHHDWKGSADGLAAIDRVKDQIPELEVTLFGVPARPADLPPWIRYQQKPPQPVLRRLYNEAAIFVGPSWAEGWPLPPAESMQCGAAPCLTDIGGHREYGIHGETALLSPPREPAALAQNIAALVRDSARRIEIARSAHNHIQQFTWDRAVSAMEQCLRNEP
jgi:glycosyltransferase involved in cell wall biosynthesis